MKFGMFLYERGAISAEQLVAALKWQNENTPPLGQIALEEGKLDGRDVCSILRLQSDLPTDRFGDLAIELGHLSKRDLAELLYLQSNHKPSLGSCLVEMKILSEAELEKQLAEFRKVNEGGRRKKVQTVRSTAPKKSVESPPTVVA